MSNYFNGYSLILGMEYMLDELIFDCFFGNVNYDLKMCVLKEIEYFL